MTPTVRKLADPGPSQRVYADRVATELNGKRWVAQNDVHCQ